jgi:hypothetical protein
MKIKKVSIWHEVLILALYSILSPFLFLIIFPIFMWGDDNSLFDLIYFITIIASIISLIIIYFLKSLEMSNKIELSYGLIPLFISIFICLIFINNVDKKITSNFMLSNCLEIVILYAISIFFKITRSSSL